MLPKISIINIACICPSQWRSGPGIIPFYISHISLLPVTSGREYYFRLGLLIIRASLGELDADRG